MDYSNFKPEDFSRDAHFQKWVLTNDTDATVFWESWLKQHPDRYDDVTKAREMIRLVGFQKEFEANEDFLEVWGNISQGINEVPAVPARKSMLGTVLKVAAVFTCLAIVAVLALSWLKSNQINTYSTDFGKIRTVPLPDGSMVTLNANSTLRVAKSWDSTGPREVWLDGEAFFEVEKVFRNALKESSPTPVKFIVHTGMLDVEVLGTQFNVNKRHNETRVVLKSGKVKLQVNTGKQSEEVFMQPGEMVAFNELNNALIKKNVNPDAHAAWKDHQLIFEEARLAEVARTLEDLYGIKISFEQPELAQEQFTGMIPYDDIHVIIEAFTKLYDIKITKSENSIVFHKK